MLEQHIFLAALGGLAPLRPIQEGSNTHAKRDGGWAKYQCLLIAWGGGSCVSVRAKPMPNCWQGTGKGDNNAFGLGVTSAFARHKAPLPFHLSPCSSIFLVSCLLSQPVGWFE
ncbi:hypothetical protein Ddc_07690 [Ditylenchus destructor]|nr:hypothetical protein Ddc_07690 [Ditylenchus destructor]